MNIIFPHPSELLYEMLLDASHTLLKTYPELFKNIVLNKKDLTEEDCECLAIAFQTSKEYWINLQKQWENSKPNLLADMSTTYLDTFKASQDCILSGSPSKCPVTVYDSEGSQRIKSVYIMTEQSYKYLLSKCTEDEAWDLGWLGASEKHAESRSISPQLKKLIEKSKSQKKLSKVIVDEVDRFPWKFATHTTHNHFSIVYRKIDGAWYYYNIRRCFTWKKSKIASEYLNQSLVKIPKHPEAIKLNCFKSQVNKYYENK